MRATLLSLMVFVVFVPFLDADSICYTCNNGRCSATIYSANMQCMSMSGACRSWDPCTTTGTANCAGDPACVQDPVGPFSTLISPDQWRLVEVRVIHPRPPRAQIATRSTLRR